MKFSVLVFFLFIVQILIYSQNQIIIPDTLSGPSINLNLQHGSVNFFPGTPTVTMGANGNILGPTIILNKNQDVTINVNNQLMETTTIHWHGLHVSPENDGGPHIYIEPGEIWSPHFTVLDWASTYWYHPHMHHHTNHHVSKGISGFIIVRDETEAAINLPRKYGVDDFPLVVQTKSFDENNQVIIENTADTTIMVNATINPFLNVPAQVVRFRLLNGSSERVFNFGLSNNQNFFQIASDGGLLASPVQLTRLMLAPGERAEILVNFNSLSGQSLNLMNYGAEIPNGIYGAAQPGIAPGQVIPGYSLNPLNGSNYSVLKINVTAATPNPVTSIPSNLVTHTPWISNDADTTRTFTFSTIAGPSGILGPFRINGAFFDMEVINEYIPFNNVEIWELRNQTPIAHPFHIHDVQFYILDINGIPPPASLSGRKDVVLVRGGNTVVRFITKFETYASDSLPFMYHCHMLTHEDEGMMGQFIVMPDPVPVELNSFSVTAEKNNVNLRWVTASEINNLGFEIERSQNENSLTWQKIGFLKGGGTKTEKQDYAFTDAGVSNGKYKYRLKQIDQDGSFEYSNIIEVDVNYQPVYSLEQNHPNPFNPETIINFSIPEKGIVTLQVFNIIGELVHTLIEGTEYISGEHQIKFSGNDLSAGVYVYRLQAGEFISSKKMLLVK